MEARIDRRAALRAVAALFAAAGGCA